MNMLIDPLPSAVEIDGQQYAINTSFHIGVQFELLMQDETLSSRERILYALILYYPTLPENSVEAVKKILWFYRCGKDQQADKDQGGSSAPAYSFAQDDEMVYAAFYDQYGIDLQAVEFLHWWKFRALFDALGDDQKIVKVMGYRQMKIDSRMPKQQREFYKTMKRIYAIRLTSPDAKLSLEARNQRMVEYVDRRHREAGIL